MLGLAQQVGSHPGGVALAVGQHQNLAGPGDHVDAHLAVDLPLGGGHIDVAGADDLIHSGDALGAVGESRHSLGAAGLEDLGHPRGGGGGQNHRADLAILAGGGGHDDFFHPGHLGGDHIHQDGGGVSRSAAGHIDPRLFDRGIFLAQNHPVLFVHHKIFVDLLAVEGLDVGRRHPQGLEEIGVGGGKGRVDLLLGDLEVVNLCAVELEGILFQGRIPPGPDVGDDGIHHIFHVLFGPQVPVEDLLGGKGIKIINPNHCFSSCSARLARSLASMASISGCLKE